MKIYRVVPDVNAYQYFMLEDATIGLTQMMTFDGTPKAQQWISPAVYVYKPKHKRGDFFDLWSTATLVVGESTLEHVRDLLEMSGELLPLPHKAEMFHVLNVTECVNVLDHAKTEWVYGKSTGARIGIKRYAFHPNRLSEAPLFKIPETCKAEILTSEGLKDPDDEFKPQVERLGLKGLNFEEVWRDG